MLQNVADLRILSSSSWKIVVQCCQEAVLLCSAWARSCSSSSAAAARSSLAMTIDTSKNNLKLSRIVLQVVQPPVVMLMQAIEDLATELLDGLLA